MMSIIEEIFSRRSLVWELVLKDLKLRYSRPALGFFWAFLSPLLLVAIFYLIFSVVLRVQVKEAPFPVYLMTALFSWRFFQDSLFSSTTSLVDNKNLIKEARFPHYLIPLSIVLANGIIFLPSLGILIITLLFYLKGLPLLIIFLPVILGIHLILTMGGSLIFSILYVKWRDIKYILEAALTILFYLTPAFYSLQLVKDSFPRLLFKMYIYNPLTGMLNLYRATLIKGFYGFVKEDIGPMALMVMPVLFAFLILLLGFYLYNKNKESINDYLAY
ncbi:MAG: hypothetical protein WC321_05320 [Candidatus Omnitrophota bacterium]|jgi:ABC-type polysaccharide/polyol phosphate export permease